MSSRPTSGEFVSDLPHELCRMVRKLERRAQFTDADRAAVLGLPFRKRRIEPHQYIVREGMRTTECCLILEGFAFRQKTTVDGARQILSIHMAGDFIDLEASLLREADHNIQALTRCEIAFVPASAIQALQFKHPMVAKAMWIDTLIDASIFREWLLNVGRREAKARVSHLICELARRLELAGLADGAGYVLPMTQEQLADATGLTPVHINRTLKTLETEGLIVRNKRHIQIPDWQRLREAAGFSELYLHVDQLAA